MIDCLFDCSFRYLLVCLEYVLFAASQTGVSVKDHISLAHQQNEKYQILINPAPVRVGGDIIIWAVVCGASRRAAASDVKEKRATL